MIKIEHRKESRIESKNLPKIYQTFTISLDDGTKINVPCIDASMNGFSFLTELSPETFPPGTEICLYLSGIDHAIKGIIVSSDDTKRGTREGVSLKASEDIDAYQSIFHIIVNDLAIEKKKKS